MKAKKKKARNQADSTLRNVRAANKKIAEHQEWLGSMELDVGRLLAFVFDLLDILKSKRLLTPAQVKMLEDALR